MQLHRVLYVLGGLTLLFAGFLWWTGREPEIQQWYWPPSEAGFEAQCDVGLTETSAMCLLAMRQLAADAEHITPARDVYWVEISRREGILVCWRVDADPGASPRPDDGGCIHKDLAGIVRPAPTPA
jgi:hypothetical protein